MQLHIYAWSYIERTIEYTHVDSQEYLFDPVDNPKLHHYNTVEKSRESCQT